MALSRVEWAEEGLAVLGEGGVKAVAVEPIAKRLGATKGSFYWHFTDRDDLLKAVVELWEYRETAQVVNALAGLPDPRAKLFALGRGAYARAARGGAHAALLASAEDPRIAPVIARVTRTRLAVLYELYRELGLDDKAADRYARFAYSLYLGAAALRRSDPDDSATEDEIEKRVELFVTSAVPPSARG